MKRWLNRANRLDQEINALMEAKSQVYARLTSGTAAADGDGVSAYSDPHKFEHYADLCWKVDAMIDKQIEVKAEILEVIEQVENQNYRVLLINRYINGKTWEQIAVEMHYSFRGLLYMHGRALEAVKPFIELRTGSVV